MSESTLRNLILSAPMPYYPASSLSAGASGVVVAAIRIEGGLVNAVQVLEAPDKDIEDVVSRTLRHWTFIPTFDGPERTIYSRLTFYFEISDSEGRVLLPAQVGREPVPAKLYLPKAERVEIRAPVESGSRASVFPVRIKEVHFSNLLRGWPLISVIDVRGRDDYLASHRSGSLNVPVADLPGWLMSPLALSTFPVIDCTFGNRDECASAEAALRRQESPRFGILEP